MRRGDILFCPVLGSEDDTSLSKEALGMASVTSLGSCPLQTLHFSVMLPSIYRPHVWEEKLRPEVVWGHRGTQQLPQLCLTWRASGFPLSSAVSCFFSLRRRCSQSLQSTRGRQRGLQGGGAGNEVSGLDGPGRSCEGIWAAVWKVEPLGPGHSQPSPHAAHHGLFPSPAPPSLPATLRQARWFTSASSMWQFHPAHQAPFPLWPHDSAESWGATLIPCTSRSGQVLCRILHMLTLLNPSCFSDPSSSLAPLHPHQGS